MEKKNKNYCKKKSTIIGLQKKQINLKRNKSVISGRKANKPSTGFASSLTSKKSNKKSLKSLQKLQISCSATKFEFRSKFG